MRILVAEDDNTSRAVLTAILTRGGHEVLQTTDGLAAWEAAQRNDAPRLLVLDWLMPKLDGLEVVKRVRQLGSGLPHYIIMLTGKSETSEVIRALAVGANDMVTKPYHAGELLARVDVGRRMIAVQQELVDQADQLRLTQTELAYASKLKAVGQLAAGIAHEINTPTQYVSDSIYFLKEAFEDLHGLTNLYRRAVRALGAVSEQQKLIAEIREAEVETEADYLEEHIPGSFERCQKGLARISEIVSAIKNFGHPDHREKQRADVNQALLDTLTIAANEYKFVADAETDLGDLPPVLCYVGDLNQVFLNLIVNAAHAIGEVVGDTGARGRILLRTSVEGDSACIQIRDSGGGIPEGTQDRIFDPFFTTKEVGKGSGQGLAISRSIVVDKHQGELVCESEPGRGTTFTIRIPVNERHVLPAGAIA